MRRRERPLPIPARLDKLAGFVADAAPARRPKGARYALVPWELIEQIRLERSREGKDETAPLIVDVCSNAGRENRLTGWFRNVKARMA